MNQLFNTILGNIILISIILLVGMNNYKYGIVLIIIVISMYYVTSYKEGFDWSQDSIDEFILLQKTINPHVVFDITQIKQQATQEELNYFLKNGRWYWSQEVKEQYMKAVEKNPYIRTNPQESMNRAMTVYNQSIILEILSRQTKRRRLDRSKNTYVDELPSGFGKFGYSSGLIRGNEYVF
jgi:hypothetical protein